MATKVKENEEAETERESAPDGPLLDLSDDAVKKMIKTAKKRGYVTIDELNQVLPSDTTSPEQIEDIMAMLNDMGINVIETDEVEEAEDSEDEAEGGEVAEAAPTAIIPNLPVQAGGRWPPFPVPSGSSVAVLSHA